MAENKVFGWTKLYEQRCLREPPKGMFQVLVDCAETQVHEWLVFVWPELRKNRRPVNCEAAVEVLTEKQKAPYFLITLAFWDFPIFEAILEGTHYAPVRFPKSDAKDDGTWILSKSESRLHRTTTHFLMDAAMDAFQQGFSKQVTQFCEKVISLDPTYGFAYWLSLRNSAFLPAQPNEELINLGGMWRRYGERISSDTQFGYFNLITLQLYFSRPPTKNVIVWQCAARNALQYFVTAAEKTDMCEYVCAWITSVQWRYGEFENVKANFQHMQECQRFDTSRGFVRLALEMQEWRWASYYFARMWSTANNEKEVIEATLYSVEFFLRAEAWHLAKRDILWLRRQKTRLLAVHLTKLEKLAAKGFVFPTNMQPRLIYCKTCNLLRPRSQDKYFLCPCCEIATYCSVECGLADAPHHDRYFCRRCSGCSRIIPIQESRKMCGGCKRAIYCGSTCQLRHWNEGGHSEKCSPATK